MNWGLCSAGVAPIPLPGQCQPWAWASWAAKPGSDLPHRAAGHSPWFHWLLPAASWILSMWL